MKKLTQDEWLQALRNQIGNRKYWAMYSSWAGGIVTDVELMMVPLDDHLVHRGDGVFEALYYTPKGMFEVDAHIDRMFNSAKMVGLEMPVTKDELKDICQKVIDAAGEPEGQMRLYVSRGPGDFSPNPYSTVGSQLYVVAMPPSPEKPEVYRDGVSACLSTVPVKPHPYAQIKSCNYLQNVMTKKESVDKGFDYAINVTADGKIAEGPTENLLVLTADRELVAPPFEYTLRGTTLLRAMAVAEELKAELDIKFVGEKELVVPDLENALELMTVGTTLGVCPVTSFEGSPVADGKVGVVAKRLQSELEEIIG